MQQEFCSDDGGSRRRDGSSAHVSTWTWTRRGHVDVVGAAEHEHEHLPPVGDPGATKPAATCHSQVPIMLRCYLPDAVITTILRTVYSIQHQQAAYTIHVVDRQPMSQHWYVHGSSRSIGISGMTSCLRLVHVACSVISSLGSSP